MAAMMTLDELIDVLQAIADRTDGGRPVHLAIQPQWPLALTLTGVAEGHLAVDDPTDEPEVSEAVWLLSSDEHPDGVIQLPSALWTDAQVTA